MRSLAIISAIVVALLLGSLLGGSALWTLLGLHDDMTIAGRAEQVREAPTASGAQWQSYGGDAQGRRFASAEQITALNVGALEVAWIHRTGALQGRDDQRARSAFQTTPILVHEKLAFCTQFSEVIALHPGSGEELWRFDPEIPLDGRPANQFTCRGVSYWPGTADNTSATAGHCASRLFVGTVDARLIALDARTGERCESFGENGEVRVEPDLQLRWPGEFQITSAPAIYRDLVITGSAIGDNLRTTAPLGTVHAFDARTGELRWRFNPIPRDTQALQESDWAPAEAAATGHANVWSTISVDEERGLVFLPTSSPSPDYFGGNRKGDNRNANSVVALEGDTGEVRWAFQTVHHDLWDYDVPAQPGLYQVFRDGRVHDVVVQATKSGLLFVLDRDTGEPFLPVEERPVPQEGVVAGEQLSRTQPFPVQPPPLVSNTLQPEDAFGISYWDKRNCARQIEVLIRRGLFTPPSEQGTLMYPFTGGGANWGSSAFDASRNLVIINMSNVASFAQLTARSGEAPAQDAIRDGAEFAPMEGSPYGMQRGVLLSPLGLPCSPPPWGVLVAVDISSGRIVWRREHGTTEDLAPGGLALPFGTPTIGGPIVTASGLIFIGAAMDDYLRAFDVETGEELWKGRLPAGGQATPMSYSFEGKQYVVIAAGGHGRAETRLGDYLMAFALPD